MRARRVGNGSIEAVLFDLDGTLLDTIDLILESFRFATETVLGEPLPAELLLHNMGVPLARQLQDIAPGHADELLAVYRRHNAAHHDEMASIYPGTLETLAELAALDITMGVVTSKGAPMAHHGLERFGLRDYFEVVVTADDVALHKPDPFPLLHAAALLGVDIAHCAYVGDSPHDVEAALQAGAVSIAALWGAFPADRVTAQGPHHVLDTIVGLPAIVRNTRGQ